MSNPNLFLEYNWTSELESIIVSDWSTIATSKAEDNYNPPIVTSEFCNIYTLPTRSAWSFTCASLETSIRSPSELKLDPFPYRAPREMRLSLNSGTWWTPWRVVMHPSWDQNWIVPSQLPCCSKIPHEDFSPLSQSVWRELLSIGTDILWTFRVNYPFIFVTDWYICNR